ncbi:MAG: UDP-3-O-(3-hydroxymyristoyl)glucosamine N-acyltransferase [Symploca sp. SIO3C6]|nr:UDP-3-O-(3-hydroxymyristoyl)glucosamine N-acyltransferase [Symploca sp. SIO3C6]NET06796.1 UDP-3-O-(3-hydroxymyristoyl)glucosamine N-acyltransferase [Symploca sp. SIO2B6]NET50512.1 UDP-3-O-(3-hydroxymyristoyl)glucosamine N-acyltransferase [Merismopedia sp. SIO2A8]
MKFSEIVRKLDSGECNSLNANHTLDPEITDVAPVEQASAGSLSYIEGSKFKNMVGKTQASALILPKDENLQAQAIALDMAWICANEPRLLFAKAIALFYQPWQPAPEIHPTAVIHPQVELGSNIYIGSHVVIQANAKIGDDVYIYPNVVIYPEAQIGNRTTLHANCTIHERTQIGSDCVIHSGAVIGAEGFGFVPSPNGWFKMEQSGYTILEDGVEVGCNSTIDRPAVGETRIGRNTKIDNLVQIGHGCQIGENCALAAQVGLAGGVKVGNQVLIAGQAGIANQAKIGDKAIITAKAGVHNDVEPCAIFSGYPAVHHNIYLKASAIYQRLPEMYQTLRRLGRQFREN